MKKVWGAINGVTPIAHPTQCVCDRYTNVNIYYKLYLYRMKVHTSVPWKGGCHRMKGGVFLILLLYMYLIATP